MWTQILHANRKPLLPTFGICYFCKPVNQDGLLVCDRQEQCNRKWTCKDIIDYRSHQSNIKKIRKCFTSNSEMEPKTMVTNFPVHESEMKAPMIGAKLVRADQVLIKAAAWTWSIWYSRTIYTMKFDVNPNEASLSNVSLAAPSK